MILHALAQILPISDAKKNQKVAVGDLSGVLQVFSIKRGELAIAFKTLPSTAKVMVDPYLTFV